METVKSTNTKYNGTIEILRYFFTIIVAVLHLWHNLFGNGWLFEGGYLAVDFFFILSGLYMSISLDKRPQNPFVFTFNKWKNMAYIYVSSILVSLLLRGTKSPLSIIKGAFVAIPDILGLQMSGFAYPSANGILWYVSSMLIVGFFLSFLYTKNKDVFVKFLAPTFVLLGYAYIFHKNGNLDATKAIENGFIPLGIIRGFSGMSAGVLLRTGCDAFKDSVNVCNNKTKALFSALQLFGFVIMAICFAMPHSKYDFYMLFAIIAILIPSYIQCFFGSSIFNRLGNNLVKFFGKQFSLAMYAYSTIVYTVLGYFIDFNSLGKIKAVLVYLPVLFVTGLIVSKITDFISKIQKRENKHDTKI